MTVSWLDAAEPPTPAQAQQAYQQGARGCGFYLAGVPNTDPYRTWTAGEEAVLVRAGLAAVPICVPDPNLGGDPAATADAAFNAAKACGLNPTVSVLYDGPHLVNTGRITGPVWLPLPQSSAPTSVGPGSAIQWGQGSIGGWSVDYNVAAPDFPFATALVCDFEHAVLGYRTVDQAVAWYQTFQARVAQLAGTKPKPTPPAPAPSTAPVADPEVDNMVKHLINLPIGPDGVGWTPSPLPYPFATVVGDPAINCGNRAEGQPPTPGTAKAADWNGGTYVEVEGGTPHATYGVWVTVTGQG